MKMGTISHYRHNYSYITHTTKTGNLQYYDRKIFPSECIYTALSKVVKQHTVLFLYRLFTVYFTRSSLNLHLSISCFDLNHTFPLLTAGSKPLQSSQTSFRFRCIGIHFLQKTISCAFTAAKERFSREAWHKLTQLIDFSVFKQKRIPKHQK